MEPTLYYLFRRQTPSISLELRGRLISDFKRHYQNSWENKTLLVSAINMTQRNIF